MTTATDTTAAPATHLQGSELLQSLLEKLGQVGYRRTAVDTWRHDSDGHNIRHAYATAEWTVTCWTDGGGAYQVKWTTRANLPTVEQVFSAVLPPAF